MTEIAMSRLFMSGDMSHSGIGCIQMGLLGRFASRQLCMGVGYVYPVYASSQALKERRRQELLEWLTFW